MTPFDARLRDMAMELAALFPPNEAPPMRELENIAAQAVVLDMMMYNCAPDAEPTYAQIHGRLRAGLAQLERPVAGTQVTAIFERASRVVSSTLAMMPIAGTA